MLDGREGSAIKSESYDEFLFDALACDPQPHHRQQLGLLTYNIKNKY